MMTHHICGDYLGCHARDWRDRYLDALIEENCWLTAEVEQLREVLDRIHEVRSEWHGERIIRMPMRGKRGE